MTRSRSRSLGFVLVLVGSLVGVACQENLPPYAFEANDSGDAPTTPDVVSSPDASDSSASLDAGDAADGSPAKDASAPGRDGDLDGNPSG